MQQTQTLLSRPYLLLSVRKAKRVSQLTDDSYAIETDVKTSQDGVLMQSDLLRGCFASGRARTSSMKVLTAAQHLCSKQLDTFN